MSKQLIVLITIFLLLSSCSITSKKRNVQYGNCGGHTIISHVLPHNIPDNLIVFGKVKVCQTNRNAKRARITFSTKDDVRIETTTDRNGNYKVTFPSKYFEGDVFVRDNDGHSFIAEDIFLGYSTLSELNLTMYTRRIGVLEEIPSKDLIILINKSRQDQD